MLHPPGRTIFPHLQYITYSSQLFWMRLSPWLLIHRFVELILRHSFLRSYILLSVVSVLCSEPLDPRNCLFPIGDWHSPQAKLHLQCLRHLPYLGISVFPRWMRTASVRNRNYYLVKVNINHIVPHCSVDSYCLITTGRYFKYTISYMACKGGIQEI